MSYEAVISIGLVLLLIIIGIWILLRKRKQKKKRLLAESTPPQEVVEEFNYAEKEMKGGLKEDGTTTNPHLILWNIAKERRFQEFANANPTITAREVGIRRTEQTDSTGDVYSGLSRRKNIQTRTSESISTNTPLPRKHQQDNVRNFLSRIRRRNTK